MRRSSIILAGVSTLAVAAIPSGAQAATFVFSSGSYIPGTTSPSPLLAPDILSITTGSNKFFDGVTFTNQSGTVDWSGGALFFSNGAVVNNQSLWDAGFNGSLNFNGGAATAFNNSGIFRKSAGAGTTTVGAIGFVNSGTIDAQTGTISFTGAATFNSGTSFVGAGTVAINTAATFNGGISSANLVFASGTFTGNAASLTGSASWSSGSFTGGWALTSGSTLTSVGGSNRFMDSASFTNDGTINWQNASALFFTNGSQFVNNGTIDYAASSSLNNNGGAISTISNSATGLIQVDADATLTVSNRFVNDGGTLTADGTINFNGGNAVFNNGTTFNGAGTNAVNAAAAFNGGINSTNLRLNNGVYTGTNAVIDGDATFAAGTFSGGWNLSSGSTLTSVGGSNRFIDAGSFANDGTIIWQGGVLFFANGSQIVNSGTIDFQIDTSFNNNGGAASSFTNNGLIEKTGGAGTTTLASGIAFDNNGTINVLSGTIALPAAFTNDGTLGGTGAFASTNLINAGSIAPGAADATGTLLLTGNFAQAASGALRTQLASSGSFDLFNISGSASLDGTLALSCIFSCAINDGDSFVILDSVGALSGTFANITTSGFLNGFSYSIDYDYAADLVRLTVLDAGVVNPVPEPATWAMMIAGFALVGVGARRRAGKVVLA